MKLFLSLIRMSFIASLSHFYPWINLIFYFHAGEYLSPLLFHRQSVIILFFFWVRIIQSFTEQKCWWYILASHVNCDSPLQGSSSLWKVQSQKKHVRLSTVRSNAPMHIKKLKTIPSLGIYGVSFLFHE